MRKLMLDNDIENISLDLAFDQFQKCNVARNLRKATITHYDNMYKIFSKFFDTDKPCKDITYSTVLEYINYLKTNCNVNDITMNTYLRGLRAILNHCMQLGYMEKFKITLVKVDKKIKQTYTDYELNLLLKKPKIRECAFSEYRNWVLSNYLLSTR